MSSDQTDWRIDLHSLGYPADNPQLQWRRGFDQFSTVDFVSDRVVAVTFITQQPVIEVQRRDNPNRVHPYRLHAIFLDSGTGKALKTLECPTDNPSAGVFPRYDGGFLFFSTDRIVLYSADWKSLKELALPQLTAPQSYLAGISESPSGKVLVVRFHQERSTRCIQIQTATLEATEGRCTVAELFTVSDDAMAGPEAGQDRNENGKIGPYVEYDRAPVPSNGSVDESKFRILIHKQGEPFRVLCDCKGTPQFVNNELISAYGAPGFSVYFTSGERKFTQVFDLNDAWIDWGSRSLRTSAASQRIAIALNASVLHEHIGMNTATIGASLGSIPATLAERVEVYDVETERQVYKLKVNKKHIKEIWGLALSPRGEKLAIDSGGVIQTYSLPPQKND